MSFRIVIITKRSILSYKDNYLVIRSDENEMIHLSEIHTLIVQSTMVTLTSYLISELMKRRIKVIICDEFANPVCELAPYYWGYNSPKRILKQINWSEEAKKTAWTEIIKEKILRQAEHLKELGLKEYKLLMKYYNEVQFDDETNREGHAAKVYFNALFGKEFSREISNSINAGLNYGYTVILSAFNREIASRGYLTQIGIHHCNEFNQFNLSSDLMEPFRVIVDRFVYKNQNRILDSDYKISLTDILNTKVKYLNKEYYLVNAITLYVQNVINYIEEGKIIKGMYSVYEV